MQPIIYRSNRIDHLADYLADQLEKECREKDIFTPLQIIVPNKAVARYLTLRQTARIGFSMGIEYPFLMNYLLRHVWKLPGYVPAAGNEVHDPARWNSRINAETITLRVFDLLPGLLNDPVFHPVKAWCGPAANPKKNWSLASRLGSFYDRCSLYRPDWITAWEAGSIPEDIVASRSDALIATAQWQGALWRKVVGEDWKNAHFPAVWNQLRQMKILPASSESIRLFGFSSIPFPVLDCLEMLSENTTVELYQLSPCAAYYGDARSRKTELKQLTKLWFREENSLTPEELDAKRRNLKELFFQNNPLTGAFSEQGRHFFNRLLDWQTGPDEFFIVPQGNSILERLQRNLLENKPETEEEKMEKSDPTLQIHSCYSVFREVETLHNYLLRRFEEDPSLTLNDIFIMTPQQDVYAPVVDAVFHNPGNSGNMLDVSLADLLPGTKAGYFQDFLKLLNLSTGKFESSAVFEVLSSLHMLEHFKITPEEMEFCRDAASRAGIRWGWDADEHKKESGIAFSENSWRSGLDRLLLGYALDEASDCAIAQKDGSGIYPQTFFSGSKAELLGRFADFVEKLHQVCERLRSFSENPLTIADWVVFLNQTAETFFGTSSELNTVLEPLFANWVRDVNNAGTENTLFTSDVILARLKNYMVTPPDSPAGFMRGKITFCGLRPMRSIPAKVICLIGMNDNAFPSAAPKQSFDLIAQLPRPGDPVIRQEDCQLFLEILMSAQKYLYISYVGRGIRDNKEYPASLCVNELKEYLTRSFGEKSFVFSQEPLQPYSEQEFFAGNPVQSYDRILCECAKSLRMNPIRALPDHAMYHLEKIEGPLPEEICSLNLKNMESFLKNSGESFLRIRLNALPYRNENAEAGDIESFDASGSYLEQNAILKKIYPLLPEERAGIKGNLLGKMRANAQAPLYASLDSDWPLWDNLMQSPVMTALPGAIVNIHPPEITWSDQTDTLSLDTSFSAWRDAENNQIQVYPSFGAVQLLNAMLEHCAANLLERTTTRILTLNQNYQLAPMAPEEAHSHLQGLLPLYRNGMKEPLYFFPKCGYELFKNPEADISGVWHTRWSTPGECEKFQSCFGTEIPDSTKLLENALKIFLPVSEDASPAKPKRKKK